MGLEVAEGSLEPKVEAMRSEGAEDPVAALSDSCEALDLNAKEHTAESNGHLREDEAVRDARHDDGTPGEVTEEAPEGPKAEEVSPLQVHTKKWSDFNTVSAKTFGEQGLYGSFSDFLSDFPADSTPPPLVSASQVISDTDFFEWPAPISTSLPGVSPELQPERPHLAGVVPIDSGVVAHQEPELLQTQAQQELYSKQGPVEQQPVQACSDFPAEQEQSVLGAAESTDPYPGWYYDYQIGEWRQVEGYAATATVSGGGSSVQNAEQAATNAVDLSSSQLGESQTNVEQVGVVQSRLGLAESQSWATQTAATQTVDEYPGWTWDYAAQTWVSVPSHDDSWQNTSGQTQFSGTQSYGQDSSWYGQQVQSVNDQSHYNGQQELLRQQPQALYSGFTSDHTNVVNTAFVPETQQWQGEQQYMNPNAGGVPQTSLPYMNGDQNWMASASNTTDASTSQSLPSDSSFNYSGSIIQNKFQQPHWGGAAQYNYYSQFTYPTAAPPKNVHEAMRTCVGRPPHSLATFGFGGKLVFMKVKDPVTLHTSNGDQAFASGEAWMPGPVQVQSLGSYLPEEQTYAGPLMGGGANMKELNKWINDRISMCPPYDSLRLLLGLLKVACQHYGKLRSQNSSVSSKEEDGPEAALAKLLAESGAEQGSYSGGSFGGSQTLLGIPSAHQLQATGLEVKRLLVSGKRKDALKCAQEGQLWGPALILARQLGEKFYSDTVTEMAQRQFVGGSPLRTLSLLLAGQPAEVFASSALQAGNSMDGATSGGDLTQDGVGGMLDEWQENLAIMAANRTPGDERVILHLGDCLWRVRGEVSAAHLCYLVADANLEPYSGNSRLCLIGADHCKYPRTYASAEAIQRTEIYEYAKVLGNPQYILLPFQAYKLIYAQMLVEAGKTAEAFRYCQTVLKTLKTAGRTPDVETWRVVATNLEDRLRMHMQDGIASKLAPGKLVNKFLSTMDWSISRIIGGPPPSVPEDPYKPSLDNSGEQYGGNFIGSRNSPGNRSGVSMMPSASVAGSMERLPTEPNRGPSRSQSEPDFGRNAKEGEAEVNSGFSPGIANTGPGRLGRLGSNLLQKATGLWGSQKNKAKLGGANKFYYDENLKKWVEEGVEPTPELAPPPPPPTTSNFFGSSAPEESHTPPLAATVASKPGTPPMPPSSSNQFSSRRQAGVRSRYVDTFNKGGAAAPVKTVLTSLVPPRPAGGMSSMPAMFVPTPVPSTSESTSEMGDNFMNGGSTVGHESSSFSAIPDTADSESNLNTTAYSSPPPTFMTPSTTIPQVPRADNGFGYSTPETTGRDLLAKNGGPTGFGSAHARASSWGGYETSFQNSHFPGEESSYRASYNMTDGFSGSEYVAPVASISTSPNTYTDFYSPNSGGISTSLPSPPALSAPTAALGMEGSGVTEIRDPTRDLVEQPYKASQSADSLVGEEMQEVEL